MLRIAIFSAFSVSSGALLVSAPSTNAYSRLQGVQLTRASDAASVELTSLWRKDVLGIGALEEEGVKLYAVGIGSAESAATFAEKTEFPASMLLADESEESDAYAAAGTRNTGRDAEGKQIFEGVESMWSAETNAGLKARGRDDLNAVVGGLFKKGIYVPLMPTASSNRKAMEKTFVQGGAFVFDGSREVFAHYDAASGAHADLAQLVEVATARK